MQLKSNTVHTPCLKSYRILFQVYQNTSVQGAGTQVLAVGLQGGLCEEQVGLPRAGHSRFQQAPTNSPQGTAAALSRTGGALRNTYLRKGKNTTQAVRRGENV